MKQQLRKKMAKSSTKFLKSKGVKKKERDDLVKALFPIPKSVKRLYMARFSVNNVAQETHFFTKKLTPLEMLIEVVGGDKSQIAVDGDYPIYDNGELVIEFDSVIPIKSLDDLIR